MTCRGFTWCTQSHTVKSDAWLKLLKRRRRWSAEHHAKIFTISTVNRGRDRRLDPSRNSRLRVTASRQSRWSLCKKGRTAATRYKINRPSPSRYCGWINWCCFSALVHFFCQPSKGEAWEGRREGVSEQAEVRPVAFGGTTSEFLPRCHWRSPRPDASVCRLLRYGAGLSARRKGCVGEPGWWMSSPPPLPCFSENPQRETNGEQSAKTHINICSLQINSAGSADLRPP